MIVFDLIKAVKAGKQLKSPEIWANSQSLTNVCVTLVGFIVGASRLLGLEIPITDEQILNVGGAIAILMGIGNSIVSVATHKEAGI